MIAAPAAEFAGPLEQVQFPEQLSARVVTPGDEPRIHGYDVERDLARHYTEAERTLLALTGELPTTDQAISFEVASAFLSAVSVAHASTHAAVLARLCGTTTSSTIGAAAIALGEQSQRTIEEHADLLRWLRSPHTPFPARYVAGDAAERETVERLRIALGDAAQGVLGLDHSPTRTAALVMALYASGLRRPERLEAALVMARLPTVLAEAFAERPTNFGNYPANLPRFSYEEPT